MSTGTLVVTCYLSAAMAAASGLGVKSCLTAQWGGTSATLSHVLGLAVFGAVVFLAVCVGYFALVIAAGALG
jgi:hypothetical protein